MPKKRSVLLLIALGFLPGCAASHRPAVAPPARSVRALVSVDSTSAMVRVDNRDARDMELYAVWQGQRMRLGVVRGSAVSAETIAPHVVANGPATLEFGCEPIGGGGTIGSDPIAIEAGEIVNLFIPPR